MQKNFSKDFRSKSEFFETIYYVKKWTKTDCFINENEIWDEKETELFIKIKDSLKEKPIEYITNEAYFFGKTFFVDNRVLIPRPETELLVNEVITDTNEYENYWDLCTGSGCVPVAIASIKKIKAVYASDISTDALDVALINAKKHECSINFVEGDFLKPLLEKKVKVNLLTMNPPYIDKNDIYVDGLVHDNEPHIALYAKDNGMFFYKELFANFINIIDTNNKFKVICEFGFKQKDEINLEYLKAKIPFSIDFKKDYSGKYRYFIIKN